MGWEWRVFFAVDRADTCFDIWRTLGISVGGSAGERRTDRYIAVSPDYGLKLRGNGGWELKIRKQYAEDSLEKWGKYHLSGVSDASELPSALKSGGLPQVTAILDRNGMHIVDTKKHRYQVQWEGVVLEQVDCELDLSEGRGVQHLRSICCEGDEATVRTQSKRIRSSLEQAGVEFYTEGYPEMICRVLGIAS
eukprot:gb/GECG01014510.1/.p1 GENE.gb/GECG01014510.1/~~gb/GECG01014510.1/.p1  ORF type:complete len:193 (+),score=21.45 gb/GECG01014510.1/:1-579(+)